MTAPRQKELRLALVCYGGVSLAIYMHGVTRELWKLLRASRARTAGEPAPEGDTEAVWTGFLESLAGTVDLRVICDIIAGASAGGLNGVLLGHAIATGASLEPLRDLWLDGADIERLLDPDARPRGLLGGRLAAFYKEPVAWFAARQSATLAAVDDETVRAEIALKLARFVRSRWFRPPLSGLGLVSMFDDAMDAMDAAGSGVPLIPPTLPLNLYVTATDWDGRRATLPIHSPPAVTEKEHRRLFTFEAPALLAVGTMGPRPQMPDRSLGDRPGLLLAARATASFPGAFPPATLGEIDQRLHLTGRSWPGRERWLAAQLPGDRPPEKVHLIDGSVLNNAPFEPAIVAVRTRPANREVDRRFVYIDPKPGLGGPTDGFDGRPPGFFTTMLRALADIPREQPIRDSLDAINILSTRVQRIRAVIDGMAPAVDAAIERAVGARFFLLPLSPARVARARSRIQSLAAAEAGFAFAGYAQLKLRGVLDSAAQTLVHALGPDQPDSSRLRLVEALTGAAHARGAFDQEAAIGRAPSRSPYVRLLRGLDLGFRIRRLRFILRRLSADMATSVDPVERHVLEQAKRRLYAALAPFSAIRAGQGLDTAVLAPAAAAILAAPDAPGRIAAAGTALDLLAETLGLAAHDAAADRALFEAATAGGIGRDLRRGAVRAFLGFPFYDIVLLPLMQDESADSFDEIRVDRISPDDADLLRPGGTRACLKGWQLNAFGAFFSRAWRENDYLWGRLHAAERLVDIVASSAVESGMAAPPMRPWKKALFSAILAAERPLLPHAGDLIDELEGVIATWTD